MDGATRLQQIIHIDLPCILPTVVIMLIMNMGGILNVGYEKSYLMQNSLNITVSEIISTYTYKIGLLNAKYSFSTAVGLFNSSISFILVAAANYISRHVTETSLW